MNYIKSEFVKLFKAPFIWILSSVYIIVYIVLFYQYTLNVGANVIEPLLKNPVNLYSFFLVMFAAFFNVIFSVVLGSRIGAKEFSDNTIQSVIQSSGRYKSFFAKIVVLFITSFLFLILLSVLGMVLGLMVSDGLVSFSITDFLIRFNIVFGSTFLLGLFAMTVSILLKSTSKSNIICIIILLAQNFLPYNISKYLSYSNPYYYLSVFTDSAFNNLKGLSFVTFGSSNTMSGFENICFLLLYFAICISAQIIVCNRREYTQ